MDHKTPLNSHPASLFIGSEQELLEHAITLLQNLFCNNKCRICIQCRKIQEQQHESVLWLTPEKQYVVEDLKVIFSTIAFALEHDQHYFFVIQKADLLSTACANALLKSLEEPPRGYHFMLLAQRLDLILPTIKSRCLMQTISSGAAPGPHAMLASYFTTTAFQDPIAFAKELDTANPNEWETVTLLDELLAHWAQQYKKNLIEKNRSSLEQAHTMMQHLKKAMLQPPMPGSSKLFLKNLFLQIKEM